MRPKFRPETKLTPAQIAGDSTDGNVWRPWRKDSTGVQWFINAAEIDTVPAEDSAATAANHHDGIIRGIPSATTTALVQKG